MTYWLDKILQREKKEREEPKTTIWGIVEGPMMSRDIPDCAFPPDYVMMVFKVSRGEEVFDAEFWFDCFDDAYVFVKHFEENFTPIILNNKEMNDVK